MNIGMPLKEKKTILCIFRTKEIIHTLIDHLQVTIYVCPRHLSTQFPKYNGIRINTYHKMLNRMSVVQWWYIVGQVLIKIDSSATKNSYTFKAIFI